MVKTHLLYIQLADAQVLQWKLLKKVSYHIFPNYLCSEIPNKTFSEMFVHEILTKPLIILVRTSQNSSAVQILCTNTNIKVMLNFHM